MTDSARWALEHGAKCPFDASDEWGDSIGIDPPPATDWAHAAARGVLADLSDRRGIRHELDNFDEDVRAEIVQSIADIIRAAAPTGAAP